MSGKKLKKCPVLSHQSVERLVSLVCPDSNCGTHLKYFETLSMT